MGLRAVSLIALVTFCECLAMKTLSKDSVLRFVSHEPINKHDKRQYKDCHHLRYTGGYTVSGIYSLHLNESFSYKVRCEHTGDGVFTVIQRRTDGNVNFKRSLRDYMYGFGNICGDYWLGLEQIYDLAETGNNVLKIDMEAWDYQTVNVTYLTFRLLDRTYYTLQIVM